MRLALLLALSVRSLACYSEGNTLIYNQDSRSATVLLDPLNNSECAYLPSSIEAVLISGSTMQRRIVYNFSYPFVKKIELRSLLGNISYGMSVLLLRSYVYEVEVVLTNIEQEVLTLDECFLQDSSIKIGVDAAEMELLATGLCKHAFNSATNISGIMLLSGRVFELDIAHITHDYANGSVVLSIPGSFLSIFELPFLECKLLFSLSGHEFEFVLQNVYLSGFGQVRCAMEMCNLFNSSVLGVLRVSDKFVVRLETSAGFAEFQSIFDQNPFTHYMYRLAFRLSNGSIFFLQHTFYSAQFDGTIKYLVFSCDSQERGEKQRYFEFYYGLDNQSEIILDLMLFNSTDLVLTEKIRPSLWTSCWRQVLFTEEQHGGCLVFQYSRVADQDVCFPIPSGSKLQVDVIRDQKQVNAIEIQLQNALTRDVTKRCYANLASGDAQAQISLFLTIKTPAGVVLHTFSDQVRKIDYKAMSIASFTVGGGFVFICLWMTVFGLIDGIRTILHARQYIA